MKQRIRKLCARGYIFRKQALRMDHELPDCLTNSEHGHLLEPRMVCDCRILFACAGVLEGLTFEVLMRIFISSNMKMNIFRGNWDIELFLKHSNNL